MLYRPYRTYSVHQMIENLILSQFDRPKMSLASLEPEIPSLLWTTCNDCVDGFLMVLVVGGCCSGGYGGGDGVHVGSI